MTDTTTSKPKQSKGKSSVEKAIAKLGARQPEITERPSEAVPAQAAPGESPATPPAPPSATPAPTIAAPARPAVAGPAAAVGGIGSAAAPDRTSKRVEIDLDCLRDAGLLTPDPEHSLLSEEFRLIKRPMLLKALERGPGASRNNNLIMVASCRPDEGKTFCAINLAMSIASEPDLTVLLVDADVARASLPGALGFEAELGLVDLVADPSLKPSEVLLRTQLDNLSILPAGRPNRLATELLASDRMVRFVDDIAERYPDRIVIFDSPPVLMSSVPSVLALHMGQILFVVEADRTTETALENALSLVSPCKNVSLILNKSRMIAGTEKFGAYYYR